MRPALSRNRKCARSRNRQAVEPCEFNLSVGMTKKPKKKMTSGVKNFDVQLKGGEALTVGFRLPLHVLTPLAPSSFAEDV